MMQLEFDEMISEKDIKDIYEGNQPKSLDAAYERKALQDGFVFEPVFPENKEWYKKWKTTLKQ